MKWTKGEVIGGRRGTGDDETGSQQLNCLHCPGHCQVRSRLELASPGLSPPGPQLSSADRSSSFNPRVPQVGCSFVKWTPMQMSLLFGILEKLRERPPKLGPFVKHVESISLGSAGPPSPWLPPLGGKINGNPIVQPVMLGWQFPSSPLAKPCLL